MGFEEKFLLKAIDLSSENVKKGSGPFGAVIVREGKIIGEGVNRVTSNFDPTAHAEIEAIRNACGLLENWWLEECEIYSSCEPCPMCLSAIYWARIKKIYFANTRVQADEIGFSDNFIYEEIPKLPETRKIPSEHHPNIAAEKIFIEWKGNINKKEY